MYTRGCTRAKPFFPPVLNPATIPNNTQTFGKDTSERYCELFLVSDFSVTFSHNRLVNTLFQQYSHKTKWTSNPKRRKTCTTATASSPDHSPESVTFVAKNLVSSLFHSYFLDVTRLYPYTFQINRTISPYLKIPRFPNNIQTIHFWYISSDIEWSISSFSLLEKKKRKHTSSVQTTSNCSFFSFKN